MGTRIVNSETTIAISFKYEGNTLFREEDTLQ